MNTILMDENMNLPTSISKEEPDNKELFNQHLTLSKAQNQHANHNLIILEKVNCSIT